VAQAGGESYWLSLPSMKLAMRRAILATQQHQSILLRRSSIAVTRYYP